MGWFKKLLNPVEQAFGDNTLIGKQRKEQKSAAKNAKKAIQQQEQADRVAAYEADINATVAANSRRAILRQAARANVLGTAATRGGMTLGARAGASAASAPAATSPALADILRSIRGISFSGGFR